MDNLPGLRRGYKTAQTDSVKPIQKMVGPLAKTPIIPKPRKTLVSTIMDASKMQRNEVMLLAMLVVLGGLAVLSIVAVEMGWFDGFAGAGTARTPSGVEFMIGERSGRVVCEAAGGMGREL